MHAPSLLEIGRSHTCGELRPSEVGHPVVLFGWVSRLRNLGNLVFIQIRDRFGVTQVVFSPDLDTPTFEASQGLRVESCVAVRGLVRSRESNANSLMPTGDIEVVGLQLEVFSTSEVLPFELDGDVGETLRLKYRYLDLRRPLLQKNFILRSKLTSALRASLGDEGFLELETPYMVKYTPGGARNFLVPSRLNQGMFYALAESPQIFKQLFMVAGMDRYFQICRCFRDEDLRNDRQPEFTQVDLEMSFATPQKITEIVQRSISRIWKELLGVDLPEVFPRMSWEDAMAKYGTDKPDLRFGLEFVDIGDLVRDVRVFSETPVVKGFRVPVELAVLTRSKVDKLTELARQRGANGLIWAHVKQDGGWQSSIRDLPVSLQQEIRHRMGAGLGDWILLVAGTVDMVNEVLCALRLELRDNFDLVRKSGKEPWQFLWVTDFPLFEKTPQGHWVSAHHPFTSPRPDQLPMLATHPDQVKAQSYDLVLNGNEIGGGSIRIHQPEVQAQVFSVLGLGPEQIEQKFGFLLEAFRYGPPPHGGIALGLDRISMLLCEAKSLREVIAFPKTQKGTDLMTGCPCEVSEDQLSELGILHVP
jgi:aspartyl-tRNA synthetase